MHLDKIFAVFLAAAAISISKGEELIDSLVLKSGNKTVQIPPKGPNGPKDWQSLSCRGGGDISVLHAAIRRGESLYVVFTLAGWSRGVPNDRNRCGAGWEKQINWMELRGGMVVAHHQRDIESCWMDAYGSIDGWKGSRLAWSADERDGLYECYFDSLEPEKGIQIAKFTPLSPNTAEQGVVE